MPKFDVSQCTGVRVLVCRPLLCLYEDVMSPSLPHRDATLCVYAMCDNVVYLSNMTADDVSLWGWLAHVSLCWRTAMMCHYVQVGAWVTVEENR